MFSGRNGRRGLGRCHVTVVVYWDNTGKGARNRVTEWRERRLCYYGNARARL